jgi:hypothetical protein
MSFNAFFKEKVKRPENIKVVLSDRFVDEKGKPLEWEIQAINAKEDDEIKAECTKSVMIPGKKDQYTMQMDGIEYIAKLTAACVKYPDLYDAELQDNYKVKTPVDLLGTMLLPGEKTELTKIVQKLCGYEPSMNTEIQKAKN